MPDDLPLCFGILRHSIPYHIHLFPTFSPLVRIPLFRAHIGQFEVIAPPVGVSPFVPHTVSFNRPFSWALPLHYSTTLIRRKYNDKLTPTT